MVENIIKRWDRRNKIVKYLKNTPKDLTDITSLFEYNICE